VTYTQHFQIESSVLIVASNLRRERCRFIEDSAEERGMWEGRRYRWRKFRWYQLMSRRRWKRLRNTQNSKKIVMNRCMWFNVRCVCSSLRLEDCPNINCHATRDLHIHSLLKGKALRPPCIKMKIRDKRAMGASLPTDLGELIDFPQGGRKDMLIWPKILQTNQLLQPLRAEILHKCPTTRIGIRAQRWPRAPGNSKKTERKWWRRKKLKAH